MQKQAPTAGRLAVMAMFALSCFALALFLWLSFGGSIPLKPQGYRFQVAFPSAATLASQADVRIAGVTVGKVVALKANPRDSRSLATIELQTQFSPLRSDARAILRQKTLLGETYIELTPGHRTAKPLPDGGRLPDGHVQQTVQIDQILNSFDPRTRQLFRDWQRDSAAAIAGRSRDLSDALGNLPSFAVSGTDLLDVLNAQSGAVQRLVRNAGVVFQAVSQNEQALHGLIVNSGTVFQATANQQRALADTFTIFPTFLDESKATMRRLQSFSLDADPLIKQLRPVAHELVPTLRDTRLFAPDLRNTFRELSPLIKASKTGLPALRDTLNGLDPLLGQVQPFLEQLNPILQWLEYSQHETSDFIAQPPAGIVDTVPPSNPDEVGHYLRQNGPTGPESVAIWPSRPPFARGNAYLPPTAWQGPDHSHYNITPEWTCDNAPGGQQFMATQAQDDSTVNNGPSCWLGPALPGTSGPGQFPHIQAANYSK